MVTLRVTGRSSRDAHGLAGLDGPLDTLHHAADWLPPPSSYQGLTSLFSTASQMHSFARRGGSSGYSPSHQRANPASSAGMMPRPNFLMNASWKESSLKLAKTAVRPARQSQSC